MDEEKAKLLRYHLEEAEKHMKLAKALSYEEDKEDNVKSDEIHVLKGRAGIALHLTDDEITNFKLDPSVTLIELLNNNKAVVSGEIYFHDDDDNYPLTRHNGDFSFML